MDTLNVNTIEPEGGTTTINVGLSGKNVIITDTLKANTLMDAGGNTIFTSDGSGNLSSVNSGFGSAQVLLSTQTASDSASLSFTSGIDSTYKEYVFEFVDINPATDDVEFSFQGNSVGGSGYNETITSTYFYALHDEADSQTGLTYGTADDQAQGTAFQAVADAIGNGADECCAGELHLFNPSSTTYVKNFYSRVQMYHTGNMSVDRYAAGYMNTTSAIDEIQFKMSSGNFDGKIKMYGIK